MRRVFVDTGGFAAHLVERDEHHVAAVQLFRTAASEAWELFTTNAVVLETHALLLRRARPGRATALLFLEAIDGGLASVERVTRADEERALRLLRAHDDKTYSLCDATSFVVMERLRLDTAIAFDRHFRDYGRFTIL